MSGIQKKLWWHRELFFIVGVLLYILANCFDYYCTVWGLRVTTFPEGNPIIRNYMELLGVKEGLFVYKLIGVCLVIALVKLIEIVVRIKKLPKAALLKKISYGVLYGGTAITVLAGSSWIILNFYS